MYGAKGTIWRMFLSKIKKLSVFNNMLEKHSETVFSSLELKDNKRISIKKVSLKISPKLKI